MTAESVYAVFEIKPSLNASTLAYAAGKVASVRRLHRTSAPIPHAGGVYKSKELTHILGGILCADTSWRRGQGTHLAKLLPGLSPHERIDIGCVLSTSSFDVSYPTKGAPKIESSATGTSLVFFLLRLIGRLQALGTVAAIDLNEYSKGL